MTIIMTVIILQCNANLVLPRERLFALRDEDLVIERRPHIVAEGALESALHARGRGQQTAVFLEYDARVIF